MSKVSPQVEIREAFPFSTRDYDVAYSSAPIVFELPAQDGAYIRLNEVDFVTSMEVSATFTVSAMGVTNGCIEAVRGGVPGDYTQYSFRHLAGLPGYFERIRISTATGVILEELDGVAYAAAMRAAFLTSTQIDEQARMEGLNVETNPNAFVVIKNSPIDTPCGYTDLGANSFKVTQAIEARFRFSSLPSTMMAEPTFPLVAGLRIEIMLRDITPANSPAVSGYHGETAITSSRNFRATSGAAANVATAASTYGFKIVADVTGSTGILPSTTCRVINAANPTEYGSILINAINTVDGIATFTSGGTVQVAGGVIPGNTPIVLQGATGFLSVATVAAGAGGATRNDQFGQGISFAGVAGTYNVITSQPGEREAIGSLELGQSVIGSGARFSAFNQWGLYVGRLVLVSYSTAANNFTFQYNRVAGVAYDAAADEYEIGFVDNIPGTATVDETVIVSLHSVVDVAPTYAVALRNCRIEYPIFRANGEKKMQLNVVSVRSEAQSGLSNGTSMSLQVASTATQCLACDVVVADGPNGSITSDNVVSFQPLINGTSLLPQPTLTTNAQLIRFIDQAYMIASENSMLMKSVKSPWTMLGGGDRLSVDYAAFTPRMTVPLDSRSLITNRLRIVINRSAAGFADAQYYIFLRVIKAIMFDGANVSVMA